MVMMHVPHVGARGNDTKNNEWTVTGWDLTNDRIIITRPMDDGTVFNTYAVTNYGRWYVLGENGNIIYFSLDDKSRTMFAVDPTPNIPTVRDRKILAAELMELHDRSSRINQPGIYAAAEYLDPTIDD